MACDNRAPALLPQPDDPDHALTFGYRLGRLLRLSRKELTECLRDRRTVLTLVLMPLLLYPLLMAAFRLSSYATKASGIRPAFRVGFASEAEQAALRNHLVQGFWSQKRARAWPSDTGEVPPVPELEATVVPDLEEAVRSGGVDLAFRLRRPDGTGRPSHGLLVQDWDMIFRKGSPYSEQARSLVEQLCAGANAAFLSSRLQAAGIQERPDPVRLLASPVAAAEGRGWSLAVFIPLVLILMTITGAVYPAIDLTAGERERGTLEILIAAPIPRVSLLIAKYVAVVAVAVLTAVVNVAAMTLSLRISGLGQAIPGLGPLSWVTLVEILALVLLFAAFFSAVLLVITSFARSFKEAQAYLIPVMLLSLAPGLLGLVPDLSLRGPLAVVPLLNIVLLARDLLEGQAHPVAALVVILSTLLYAFAAITAAARLFGAEAVIYTESATWWKRRPRRRPADVTPVSEDPE